MRTNIPPVSGPSPIVASRRLKMWDKAVIFGLNKILEKEIPGICIVVPNFSVFMTNFSNIIEETLRYSETINGVEFSWEKKIFCNVKTNMLKWAILNRRRNNRFTKDLSVIAKTVEVNLANAKTRFIETQNNLRLQVAKEQWLLSFFPEGSIIFERYSSIFVVRVPMSDMNFEFHVSVGVLDDLNTKFEVTNWRVNHNYVSNPLIFKHVLDVMSSKIDLNPFPVAKRKILFGEFPENTRISKNEKTLFNERERRNFIIE